MSLLVTPAWVSASESEGGDVTINVPHGAHLRATGGMGGQIVTSIPHGTSIKVTGAARGHWIPVAYGDHRGFVHQSLLSGEVLKTISEAQPVCDGDCASAQPKHQAKRDAEAILGATPLPPKRPKQIKSVEKPVAASPSAPHGGHGPLPHADAIQRNIYVGLRTKVGYCALAVWRILLAAHLVKGSPNMSGADAIDMGRVLKANGFISDPSVCERPGVTRVYWGNRSGRSFYPPMSGDTFGHIEIYSLDRQYHSYYASTRSITQSMQARFGTGERRPLRSCWYKP